MIGSKFIAWAVAILTVVGAYGLSLAEVRAEDVPPSDAAGEATTPSNAANEGETKQRPSPPIRFKTVDFQDANGGPGKLKLAGTAGPGSTVYIFVDQQPYVKVVADSEGNWSAEGDLELDGERHMLRAEQYDTETRMLAGRAMVTIGRNPNPEP